MECIELFPDKLFLRRNTRFENYSMELFSAQDIRHINEAQWALEYEGESQSECMFLVERWLVAIRYIYNGRGPFVKYRICVDDDSKCARLTDAFQFYNRLSKERKPTFSKETLLPANDLISTIIEMENTSPRTKNAFYFSMTAFRSQYWGDAYLYLVASQEALLSKDTEGKATQTFAKRTASLIRDEYPLSLKKLEDLYNIRSQMIHGKYVPESNSKDNLKTLNTMEMVHFATFRMFLKKQLYASFSEKTSRDLFLSKLNDVI